LFADRKGIQTPKTCTTYQPLLWNTLRKRTKKLMSQVHLDMAIEMHYVSTVWALKLPDIFPESVALISTLGYSFQAYIFVGVTNTL